MSAKSFGFGKPCGPVCWTCGCTAQVPATWLVPKYERSVQITVGVDTRASVRGSGGRAGYVGVMTEAQLFVQKPRPPSCLCKP